MVQMSRPRGYFGIPRDVVLLDGKEPTDVAKGVAGDSATTLRLPASEIGRPIIALFNEERIVCRGWPAAENRITIAELTYSGRIQHGTLARTPRSTTSRAGSNSRWRPRSSPAA